MKGLIISAFAAVALLAAVATLHPRPSSVDISLGSAAMPSLLGLHTTAGMDELPLDSVSELLFGWNRTIRRGQSDRHGEQQRGASEQSFHPLSSLQYAATLEACLSFPDAISCATSWSAELWSPSWSGAISTSAT